jgi:hypothetical protein
LALGSKRQLAHVGLIRVSLISPGVNKGKLNTPRGVKGDKRRTAEEEVFEGRVGFETLREGFGAFDSHCGLCYGKKLKGR